ncbi:dolichyl-phosphate beta-glucosyltransferase [Streptomyces griseoaurantiacus]|uniref:dolichyl-phosphate beta-glucosyltransferase n=1 Tax=Streptomyces griseoaurantiacus TaxID=68213 RepID=UPI00345FCCCF
MSRIAAQDVIEDMSATSLDLTVVVPAYNEERRLAPTLDAIVAHLNKTVGDDTGTHAWEVLVVDDGSTDATGEVVAEAAARDPRIRLVSSPANRGKGNALRLGVLASRGRRVLVTDADLAAPIEELDRLEAALAEGGAAAIGSRATDGATIERHQHRIRELLGRAGNVLIRQVAVPGIRDTQCGFKLFEGDRAREAFAASRLDGWGIDVEILQYFRRAGWPVAEVPVRWAHQPGSKVRPLDYGRMLAELAVLKVRALRPADLLVPVLFLLLSLALYSGRWADPNHRYLPDSLQDQNQWEWFFAVTADNISHFRNPLFTTLQGFPDGVNLMANTVMLGLSVPFAPITLWLGPAVSLALVMTLGLAATATAWYWLLVRRVVRHRGAAFAGAALATFAPPMISHANAHPNFVVLFMIPLMIDRALRLCAGTRVGHDGIVLGLMTAYQIYLGEEPLLLTALGLVLFAGSYALLRRDVARAAWRPLAKGLGIAVAVCLPLVSFALYWQFFGPQSYKSVLHGDNAGNSPLALIGFSERSLAGGADRANALSLNPTEQNAFYGWPLALLALGIVVRLWDRTLVKALAITAAGAALLSLGPKVRVPLTDTVLPGPWKLLAHRPLFESVIEGRVAMVCAPALGMLLALALERLAPEQVPGTPARVLTGARLAGLTAVVLALLPIVPAPLRTEPREKVPAFVADGTYKKYIAPGQSLVPVPLPDPGYAGALHWQTAADLGFSLPGGYFNGPWGPDRIGIYGAVPRATSNLFNDVRNSGTAPNLEIESWRRQARADFAYWKAGALVLAPQANDEALRRTVEDLTGSPGTWVGGVWVWDLDGKGTITTRPGGDSRP